MTHPSKNRSWVRLGLSLLVGVALLYICFHRVDLVLLGRSLQGVRIPWLVFSFSMIGFVLIFKTFQFNVLLTKGHSFPFKDLFSVICIWLGATNFFPFLGGEALTVYLMGSRMGVGKTRTLSILTLEQVADGISILGMILLLSFFATIPHWMKGGIQFFIFLVLTASIVLLLLARRFSEEPAGTLREQKGLLNKLGFLIASWAFHLKVLRNIKQSLLVVFFSVTTRLVEYLSLWAVGQAFGIAVPWWTPLLALAAVNIAVMVPVAPANLGVFEAAVLFIYQSLGVAAAPALGVALAYHAISVLPLILLGYGYSLKLGFKRSASSLEGEKHFVVAQNNS